jgi:hypothetical protein
MKINRFEDFKYSIRKHLGNIEISEKTFNKATSKWEEIYNEDPYKNLTMEIVFHKWCAKNWIAIKEEKANGN